MLTEGPIAEEKHVIGSRQLQDVACLSEKVVHSTLQLR